MAIANGLTKKVTGNAAISAVGKAAKVWAITYVSGTTSGSILIRNGTTIDMYRIGCVSDGTAGNNCVNISFKKPIICSNYAFSVLTGTGAVAYVLYDELTP